MKRLLFLVLAVASFAANASATLPVYRAGSIVETRVRVSREADEMELILEVERPIAQRIRLTPEFLPQTSTIRWIVPDVEAERASLRLRVGHDGEEVLGPVLDRFRIAHESGDGIEFRDGEWWPSNGTPGTSPIGFSQDASWSAAPGEVADGVVPRDSFATLACLSSSSAVARVATRNPLRRSALLDASPSFVPQRI